MAKTIINLGLVMVLSGCSLAPGLYYSESDFVPAPKPVEHAKVDITIIPITSEIIKNQNRQPGFVESEDRPAEENYEYLVGPQDVLSIIVWEHPELTIPAGDQRPVEKAGHRVNSQGMIFYPYVGLISVAGKTTDEIRRILTRKLSRYIKHPQLDVRVVEFNSQKAYVTGEVKEPGNIPITDVPLRVADAINLLGGATEKADVEEVVLSRNGENIRINLLELYYRGDLSENYLLQDRDILYVPENISKKVYVMGEVTKEGVLPMIRGRLQLAEVLSASGVSQESADPEKIFVLRQEAGRPVAYQLDASEPGALILATAFQMKPRDVVFVSTAQVARWNRLLIQLLPTAQTLWTLDRISSGSN